MHAQCALNCKKKIANFRSLQTPNSKYCMYNTESGREWSYPQTSSVVAFSTSSPREIVDLNSVFLDQGKTRE